VPRVTGERLLRVGLDDVAYETCGGNLAERIDEAGRDVGDEGQVAELDRLEAGEVRSVESQALGEKLAAGVRRGDCQAVPAAQIICELEVDELDALPLYLGLEFSNRGKDVTTPLFSMRSEDGQAPRTGRWRGFPIYLMIYPLSRIKCPSLRRLRRP